MNANTKISNDIFLIDAAYKMYTHIPKTTKSIFLFCLFISLITYWYQISGVAFNDDDVEQLQSVSTYMIAIGRWGTYFIHEFLFNHLSAPPVDSLLGISFQIVSAMLIANIIGIKKTVPIVLLILFSTIHPYFSTLYSYDSSRLSYPLSNLFISISYYLVYNKHKKVFIYSAFIFSLSPSLYPASLEYAGSIILLLIISNIITQKKHPVVNGGVIKLIILSAVGSILYLIETTTIQHILNITPWDRIDFNLLAIVNNYHIIYKKVVDSLTGTYIYNSKTPTIILLFTIAVFIAYFSTSLKLLIYLSLSISILLITPIWLALIAQTDTFPYRSLYSYGLIYGGIISLFLSHYAINRNPILLKKIIPNIIFLLSIVSLSSYIIYIAQYNLKERVSYQADMAVINRIISRFEQLENYPYKDRAPIPLTVVGKPQQWFSSTAIGFMPTNRFSPWAKERVFRLLESRYQVPTSKQRKKAEQVAKNMPPWPHKNSVKYTNGILILKLGG